MCEKRTETVESLSNKDLARLLLRLLWQKYDVGGISMGRAPESCLLESAMDILPLSDIEDMDGFLLEEMMEEGHTRLKIIKSGSQLFFHQDQLTYLSDLCLAYLTLKKLSELFEELEINRGYPVPQHEKELVGVAVALLSVEMTESLVDINKLFTLFSTEDILTEVSDRVYSNRKNKPQLF